MTTGDTTAALALGRRLDEFSASLHQRLRFYQSHRRETDRLLATEFNVFDYIDPNENQLSDIFADLLDPEGNHGQRNLFLLEFISLVGVTFGAAERLVVIREDRTALIANALRRIDITIAGRTSGLGIENKPWCEDQNEQVFDYVTELRRRFREQFLLVYLSGDGSPPTSITAAERKRLEQKGQFRMLGYGTDVLTWLRACQRVCEADKVRWFLREFIDYIARQFPTHPVTETEK